VSRCARRLNERSSRPWSRPPLFLNASRVNAFDQPGAVCTVEEKVDHQQLEDTLAPVTDFAAVSRVDWRPKCSRILDGVKSQYFWPQHFIFSFCSIPGVEDLPQVAWVVGARNGSFYTRPHPVRATIFFYRDCVLPPEVNGRYPSQGTPLGSSWNLEFLNLTWHGPFLSRIPAGIPDS
jgi:hypothetical protein